MRGASSELKANQCENSMGLDVSSFLNATEPVGMDSDDLVSTLNVKINYSSLLLVFMILCM